MLDWHMGGASFIRFSCWDITVVLSVVSVLSFAARSSASASRLGLRSLFSLLFGSENRAIGG